MEPWHSTGLGPNGPIMYPSGLSMLPKQGSTNEQNRIVRSSEIEAGISGNRLTAAFVGNIPEGATDEVIDRLLQSCGPIIKWKRVLDAGNMPKSFGFCEFGSADAMHRALHLLHDLPLLGGKKLIVKVDDATLAYLGRYEEAMRRDQVEMSSKEADLAACQNICAVLREKNFYSALEAMDKKIALLSAEEPEEGEAIDSDHGSEKALEAERRTASRDRVRSPERRRSSRDAQSRERRESQSNESLSKAYKEREARWESREAQMAQRRRRDEQIETERKERAEKENDYAIKYLANFDDMEWLLNSLDRLVGISGRELSSASTSAKVPDFYANRELWKSRRSKEREREDELDRRDEEAERIEAEKDAAPVEPANVPERSEDGPLKRSRPTASEFIEESVDGTPNEASKRRKPLIDRDYQLDELLKSGLSIEDANAKLNQLYKEKIAKLIELIPRERERLFAWPVEWKYLDAAKILSLIRKKISERVEKLRKSNRDVERVAQSMTAQIQQQSDPQTIVAWILEDAYLMDRKAPPKEQYEDASVFVAILWRYLVYETEAAAYNIVPPK